MESKKEKCPAYKHSWKKWNIAKKVVSYSNTTIILQQWVSSLALLTWYLLYNCASYEDVLGAHSEKKKLWTKWFYLFYWVNL